MAMTALFIVLMGMLTYVVAWPSLTLPSLSTVNSRPYSLRGSLTREKSFRTSEPELALMALEVEREAAKDLGSVVREWNLLSLS